MKIYTEEQVRKAIELSLLNAKLFIHKGLNDDKYFPTVDEGINTITPIELPSDEELDKIQILISSVNSKDYCEGFSHGIDYMKEQILNQNK